MTLVSLFRTASQLALSDGVRHTCLDLPRSAGTGALGRMTANVKRVQALRQVLKSAPPPDFVISHMDQTNVATLLAAVGLGRRVIAVEHVDPRHHPIGLPWEALRLLTYPAAWRIVTVSERMIGAYPRWLRGKLVAVHNPILAAPPDEPVSHGRKRVVAMGRLTNQKGFDVLLKAFADVSTYHPDATLTIWGSGPERERLEDLIGELALTSRVRLAGFTSSPFHALAEGSVFVSASRYEGFGLALAEAMALGMPVVATDCDSGPGEIVRHGIDGLLVPVDDAAALAEALRSMLDDPARAAEMGMNARDVRQRFSLRNALQNWERVFAG